MSTQNSGEDEKWVPFVPTIDEQNPWPGLAPYPVWAASFFHGREEEIQELLRLIRRDDLAVVHGKSGVGKTSLLRAGFIPLLEREECMPVYIRLNHSPESPSLVDQVKHAITQAMILARVEGPPTDDQTLWEYFHRRGGQFWGPRNRLLTPVLIFNKFEELFSLGCASDETRHRTNEFLPQLIDLIDNRQPLDVRRRLLDGSTESAQWNFEESGCKVVLCLRKEYVTDLDWLALRALSDEKRLALGMLRGDMAVDSVASAGAAVLDRETAERIVRFCADSSTAVDVAPAPASAAKVGAGATPAGQVNPGAAGAPVPPQNPPAANGAPIPTAKSNPGVVRAPSAPSAPPTAQAATTAARPLEKLEVEPALLSLICRELNTQRQRLGASHIDASQLTGTPADILTDFYERSVGDLPPAIRTFVEERLLTKFGYRRAIVLEEALAIEGVAAESIRALIDRQLLRVDDRLGTTRLEISHDVLIEPVRQSRDARRAAEEAALLERIRREFATRMRRDRVAIAATLVLCAIGLVWLAAQVVKGRHQRDQQRDRAGRAEQRWMLAKAEFEAAQKARKDAEIDRDVANSALGAKKGELTAAQAEKATADQREAENKIKLAAMVAAKEQSDLRAKASEERYFLQLNHEALVQAETHGHDGDLLNEAGKADLAMAEFKKELDGLMNLNPVALASPSVQKLVADTNEKLANLALKRNDPAAAQGYFEAAQTSLQGLIAADLNNLELRRRSLAITQFICDQLRKSNSVAVLWKYLNDGQDATRKLLALAPNDAAGLRFNCYFAAALGDMDRLVAQGEPSAREHYADAAHSWAALLALNPADAEARKALLQFAKLLGDMSLKAGKNQDAVHWYELGLGQLGKSYAATDADLSPWNDPPEYMHGEGLAHLRLEEFVLARDAFVAEVNYRLAHQKPANPQKLWSIYGDLAAICIKLPVPDYPAARDYLQKRLALAANPPTAEQRGEFPKLYAALGKACLMSNDTDAAQKAFQAGLDIEPRNPVLMRGLADVYSQVADAKLRARQHSDARGLLEKASVIYGSLNADNPHDVELRRVTLDVYQHLGDLLLLRGDAAGSQTIYTRYVAIAEAAANPPDASDSDLTDHLLNGYEGLGDASIELKNGELTKSCFEKFQKVIESQFTGDKSSAAARYARAGAYGKLGTFCDKRMDPDARHYFELEIQTLDDLPEAERSPLYVQNDLSQALGKLASICTRTKDKTGAVNAYRRAVEVDEKLTKANPSNQDWRRNASASNTGLADALLELNGSPESAEKYYLNGRDIAQDAVKAEGSVDNKLLLAKALRQCGYMSLKGKKWPEAAEYYRKALVIDESLFAAAPEDSDLQLRLARDLIGVGAAARSTGDARAASAFDRARAIITPLRAFKSTIGHQADDLSESIDGWQKGTAR